MRVAVVGAGPAGLAAARELRAGSHGSPAIAAPPGSALRALAGAVFASGVWAARQVTAAVPGLPA